MIFIQLAGSGVDGNFPPDTRFPYLLPDDQEADGSDRYSAALVLSQAMIPYIENGRLDVLNNLLFPGENVFEERERHTPADLAVFGNINAKRTRISLEPTFQTIQAGGTQRFTLHDWNGREIEASEWEAVSLQSHTPAGHGTITSGVYTAAPRTVIGHDSLHVVVTAKYIADGKTYTASALLLVVFDSVIVVPHAAVYPVRALSQPIVLKASTVDGGSVTWASHAPDYGELTPSGNQAIFTPDIRSIAKGLVVQQIEVSGAETRLLSLVLMHVQQQLRIVPAYVPAAKTVALQLRDDTTLLPGIPRRWRVISGGGTVSSNGHFTALAQGPASSSVVQCEIVSNGVVLSSGYSIVELSELEPEGTWETLSRFTIKVPGGLDEGRLGSLYANGYQQLKTEIVVETNPVGNTEYPLSVNEKASMRLVDDWVGAEINPVEDPLDGIPAGDRETWRSRLVGNRFELAASGVAVPDNSPNAAISRINIYLHSRAEANDVNTFRARFQKDGQDFKWFDSTDFTDQNAKIEIRPLGIPHFQYEDYAFKRARVDGGAALPGEPEEDDFDLHLRTLDYWKFAYTGNVGLAGTAFETLEFVSVDANDVHTSISTSTIRWESEQMAETMFSWTGYIFKDPLKEEALGNVKFDDALVNVVKNESLEVAVVETHFDEGQLVITLHRSDRIPYIRRGNQSRDKLSRDLLVKLVDKRGNPHFRRISFLPSSIVGDRNKLDHNLFKPVQLQTGN
ncbi:hypothetical protein [Pseudomonas sp. OA65]|uniref:hypothetical protein n=1 Tax=Pseudomonas sp. OA65 TaxID=2818431 RepID=UPI001A9F6676|nr:hypothetical protein [Pseudomonas sp. OA65]MBO1542161.1 hypothetical protein [Pseudomonas sp. OA65]